MPCKRFCHLLGAGFHSLSEFQVDSGASGRALVFTTRPNLPVGEESLGGNALTTMMVLGWVIHGALSAAPCALCTGRDAKGCTVAIEDKRR